MKIMTLVLLLGLASFAQASDFSQLSIADPLFKALIKSAVQPGGVSTVVRAENGETVVLKLEDITAPRSAALAPATVSAAAGLTPCAGLAPKKVKHLKGRLSRRALQQLHDAARAAKARAR